ncbi:MAG TPA: hypothetical protein VF573_13310 [Paraburkholderia sp.]|uniref:hypothetical protein n=1 Tax=Paraburkholderia sp. TaxID=1926495 RepID=UPI002ED367B7
MEHNAYVSLDTGEVYWTTLKLRIATLRFRIRTISISEEVSPCAFSHKRYLRVTARSKDLSDDKALTRASRDLLQRKGVLEAWYTFGADSVESALRQWCAENGIEILET